MNRRITLLLLGVTSLAALAGCESGPSAPLSRVCPETAIVVPGGNQRFRLCDESIPDSIVQWSNAGPGFMTQGRYHAPLVVNASTRVTIRATPERFSGVPAGRAVVLLAAGAVPGVDSCAGPAQAHLPAPNEYVEVDELPDVISAVAPIYPDSAIAHGIEGLVIVSALVCAAGNVIDVYVLKSIPELDDATEHAVRQFVFRPARNDGLPVAVWVVISVRFSIYASGITQYHVALGPAPGP